jgi:hypothetical protein
LLLQLPTERQIFQLTFLQATAINQIITILPLELKVIFPEWLHKFGITLLMLKYLYGSVPGRKSWDDEQSAWLKQEFGFK